MEKAYKKLRARILEQYATQAAFAEALGIGLVSLNQRLSGRLEWRACEMAKCCDLLGLALEDIPTYFFMS